MSSQITQTKRCTKCLLEKNTTEFGPRKKSPDGLNYWCRICMADNARKNRVKNPEKARARRLRYHYRHKDKEAVYYKQWATANKEKRSVTSRKYWANKNPEERRIVAARKRAIRRGAERTGTLIPDEWQEVLEYCNYKCVYCGAPWEHMDHFVPLSKGGEHTKENVVPACAPCNLSKKDKDPLEFLDHILGK